MEVQDVEFEVIQEIEYGDTVYFVMLRDNFQQEYEEEGWFSRIGDSIKGIFGGIAIFMLAFPLIFWNECRAVVSMRWVMKCMSPHAQRGG